MPVATDLVTNLRHIGDRKRFYRDDGPKGLCQINWANHGSWDMISADGNYPNLLKECASVTGSSPQFLHSPLTLLSFIKLQTLVASMSENHVLEPLYRNAPRALSRGPSSPNERSTYSHIVFATEREHRQSKSK